MVASKNRSHSFCPYLQYAPLCNIVGEKSIICKNILENKFLIVLNGLLCIYHDMY